LRKENLPKRGEKEKRGLCCNLQAEMGKIIYLETKKKKGRDRRGVGDSLKHRPLGERKKCPEGGGGK